MKLKPKSPPLPENVFTLNEDSLPTLSDADPWMKIMVWRKDVGWSIIQYSEACLLYTSPSPRDRG